MNIARLAAIAAVAIGTAAHAAPQEIARLPRIVVTGKSAAAMPAAKIEQLPRVVVSGVSIESQLRRQQLAAAQAARRT